MRISGILKVPRRVRRVAHIAQKLGAHGLGFVVHRLELRRYLPTWLHIPGLRRDVEPERLAREFAAVLEELGPTFVKFGQMLATRPDLLPPDYIHELERICHHVAPFPAELARKTIEEEFGRPVDEAFREFVDEPAASGSIAQVHHALLKDGTPVVVKIRRPHIQRTIEDDMAILAFLAEQAHHVEEFRPLRLPMLVEEFGRGIARELDLVAEAAYTHRLGEAFKEDDRIEIPRVYWDFTSASVLTMRRVTGTHLTEYLRADSYPWDRQELATALMDVYLRQFFTLGLFHADPHPGNLVITEQGKLALLDFGLVGRVGGRLRRKLGVCLVAMGNGQLELVADVLSDIGRVPGQYTASGFQQELAGLLERHTSVPLGKLDFQRSFYEAMDVIRKYEVEIPRDLVLLGRTLVVVSGLVMQMAPGLNVGSLARPYAAKLVKQRLTPTAARDGLTAAGYQVSTLLSEVPRELRALLNRLQAGLFEFTIRHEGFEKALRELDQTGNRLSLSIILAAIIMASSTLLSAEIGVVRAFKWDVSLPGLVGLAFGFVLGVWLIASIMRSRRI